MTPLQCYDIHIHLVSSSQVESFANCQSHLNSGFMALCGFGRIRTLANASSSVPLCITRVVPLPSSTSWSHPFLPGTVSMCSMHHQNTGSVSPSRSERPMKEPVPAPSVRHTWKTWSRCNPPFPPYHIQDRVNELSALSEVAIRPIIAGANLAENQVVGLELIVLLLC